MMRSTKSLASARNRNLVDQKKLSRPQFLPQIAEKITQLVTGILQPRSLRPWQGVIGIGLLFFISWVVEYFLFKGYARLDLLTPILLIWILFAPLTTWTTSLVFAAILWESTTARPVGLIFAPILSAGLILTVIKDSLILSRFQVWSVVFLLSSAWVASWEWLAFWLLSKSTSLGTYDLFAASLQMMSAVLCGLFYISKISLSNLRDPGQGGLS